MKLLAAVLPLTLSLSASAQAFRVHAVAPVMPAVSGAAAPSLLSAPAMSAVAPLAAAPVLAAPAAVPVAPAAVPVAPAATAQDVLQAAAAKPSDSAQAPSGAVFDGGKVNSAVAAILQPFNNPVTQASLVFSKLATNPTRAIEAALKLAYSKKGPGGEASVKLDELSYSYPEAAGAKPEFRAKGSLGMDLLSVATQKQLNEWGATAQSEVDRFVADAVKQYGPAATIGAKVTRRELDAAGNLTGLGYAFDVDADLAKLPAQTDPKSVLVTALHATVDITLKGLSFAVTGAVNPLSSDFASDQPQMKEAVDQIIKLDPTALQSVSTLFQFLDMYGTNSTRAKPAPASQPTKPSIDVLRAAKDKVAAALAGNPDVVGIGIGDGVVTVNFKTEAAFDAALRAGKAPANVDGIQVLYTVTGVISPR